MPSIPPAAALAAASEATGLALTPVRPVTRRRGAAVYRLSDGAEGRYALKVATGDDDVQRPYDPVESLRREAVRMQELPEFCAAAYLADGSTQPRGHWILKRWLDGNLAHRRAIELREADDHPGLVAFFAEILSTVARLHDKGFVHGDIQPNHLLVTDDGQLVFLDWALSQRVDRPEFDYRGAFIHFAAPEVVRSMRAETSLPYTVAQEVFSVGATLFCFATDWTVTGVGPNSPSPSRDRLFARIVDDGPLDYGATGAPPIPVVEAVLRRCLAPSPTDRWQSLAAAADHLMHEALPSV